MSQHHFKLVLRDLPAADAKSMPLAEVDVMLGYDRMLRRFEVEVADATLPHDRSEWTEADEAKICYDSLYHPDLKTLGAVEVTLQAIGIALDRYPLVADVFKVLLFEKYSDHSVPLRRNIIERYTALRRPEKLTDYQANGVPSLMKREGVQHDFTA